MSANLSAIFYLISGVLFILALRGLSSPETSRQGNFLGILGMVIAITITFLYIGNFSAGFIYVLILIIQCKFFLDFKPCRTYIVISWILVEHIVLEN